MATRTLTNLLCFRFSKFLGRFFELFFQFFPQQNGPAHSTSLSFRISPKFPVIFWNRRPKNRTKVWYILKNNVIDEDATCVEITDYTYDEISKWTHGQQVLLSASFSDDIDRAQHSQMFFRTNYFA